MRERKAACCQKVIVDEIRALKIRNTAKRYARQCGFIWLADDFSQYAVLAVLEGRKAQVWQLFSDYTIQEIGVPGRSNARWLGRTNTFSLDQKHGRFEHFRYHDVIGFDDDILERIMFNQKVSYHLSQLATERDLRLYCLRNIMEWSYQEITEDLNMTLSAVKNAFYRMSKVLDK